jgi:uncharacterized membrane protein YdjX (TVP38/TMEM64 family)
MMAAVFAAILTLVHHLIDIEAIHTRADQLNGWVAFGFLTVLPLVGFPVSVLHVAAGIRFGAGWGMVIVSCSILLQLLASYAIVHHWRHWLEKTRWIRRLRERVPDGAHPSICIFTVLLPGAPYSAINYVLPLVGVPLRTYVMCCLPLHTLRSTITVVLGDQSDRLTAARLIVLVAYALTVLGASFLTYRRMRFQLEGPPVAEDDRKQPA